MAGIVEEIIIFQVAVISGAVVRFFYQSLCCFRKIWKHKRWVIELEDLGFWIGTALYLFVQIYYTNNGVIRGYFILGIVVGAIIASRILKKIKKLHQKIYNMHFGKDIAKNVKKRYYN